MNLFLLNKWEVFNLISNIFKLESVKCLDILLDNLIKTKFNLISNNKEINIKLFWTIFNFPILFTISL